jgi:hypothetical protein
MDAHDGGHVFLLVVGILLVLDRVDAGGGVVRAGSEAEWARLRLIKRGYDRLERGVEDTGALADKIVATQDIQLLR